MYPGVVHPVVDCRATNANNRLGHVNRNVLNLVFTELAKEKGHETTLGAEAAIVGAQYTRQIFTMSMTIGGKLTERYIW